MNAVVLNRDWYLPSAHPALVKLQRLQHFRDGWAFGEGRAFAKAVAMGAEQILESALQRGFSECDVFPGRNGQIIVTVYSGRNSVNFCITGDSHAVVSLSHEVDGEEIDLGGASLPPVPVEEVLLMLGGSAQWLSFESFTRTNTRAGAVDSRVPLSSPRVMAPAYPSSTLNVQSLNLAQYARTLRIVTAA